LDLGSLLARVVLPIPDIPNKVIALWDHWVNSDADNFIMVVLLLIN